MKVHINDDKELVAMVRAALKENDGYCPCVHESWGKPEYQCMCENFLKEVKPGQPCHCGLYIKDAD